MRAFLSLRVSSRRAWLGVVCMLGVAAVVLGVRPGVPPAARAAVSVTFTYTGSEQTFVVPAGVTSLHVVAIGAPGGLGGDVTGGAGGKGARVETDIAVTPGQTLYIEVGGAGGAGAPGASAGGAGGFNGGGNGGNSTNTPFSSGGGGGGASDVRTVSCGSPCNPLASNSLASRLVVAAGGGGGGGLVGGAGGDAGQAGSTSSAGGGGAGTLTAGGAGGAHGTGGFDGSPGGLGVGGAGANGGNSGGGNSGGGGGGGGCYGGGGGGNSGGAGGGGGGSSCVFVNGIAQSVAFTVTTDPPQVILSYIPPPPTSTPTATPTPTPTPAPAGPQLPPGFSLPPIQTLITTLPPGCTRVSTSLLLPPNTPVSVFLGQFTPPSAVVSITRVDPVTGQTQLLYSTDPQAQVQGQTVGPGQVLSICVNSPAKYTYTSP